ncbi:MAG: DUF1961 family protein [Bacteroidota bacterium]
MKASFLSLLLTCLMLCWLTSCQNRSKTNAAWAKTDKLFEFKGHEDWTASWMLDGLRSKVISSEKGMELIAGPEPKNDTCHTVLWTQQSFAGNICIEYDYTRTDTTTRYVNILYFLATGEGSAEYPTDIARWNEKRIVPHMRTYFRHMNTYHISYAAITEQGARDYIRLRRYDPSQERLKGTDIPEDYFQTGLFKPEVTYHIEVCKYGDQLEMHIQNKGNASDVLVCQWDITGYPPCTSGRIGFRHMYTRSARYKDIKVWRLEAKAGG